MVVTVLINLQDQRDNITLISNRGLSLSNINSLFIGKEVWLSFLPALMSLPSFSTEAFTLESFLWKFTGQINSMSHVRKHVPEYQIGHWEISVLSRWQEPLKGGLGILRGQKSPNNSFEPWLCEWTSCTYQMALEVLPNTNEHQTSLKNKKCMWPVTLHLLFCSVQSLSRFPSPSLKIFPDHTTKSDFQIPFLLLPRWVFHS